MRFVLCLLPLVAGCLTANTYGDALQGEWCKRAEACDPDAFADEYGSQAECRAAYDQEVQDATDCFAAACDTFDAAAASEGLDDIAGASCAELGGAIAAAVEQAYQDCNNGMLLTCLGG